MVSCYVVHIRILQAAQVVLVGAIQQIICCNANLCHLLLVDVYIRTYREA